MLSLSEQRINGMLILSVLFNFQGPIASRFCGTAYICYHISGPLSRPFLAFFAFFFRFAHSLPSAGKTSPLRLAYIYYHLTASLSTHFSLPVTPSLAFRIPSRNAVLRLCGLSACTSGSERVWAATGSAAAGGKAAGDA